MGCSSRNHHPEVEWSSGEWILVQQVCLIQSGSRLLFSRLSVNLNREFLNLEQWQASRLQAKLKVWCEDWHEQDKITDTEKRYRYFNRTFTQYTWLFQCAVHELSKLISIGLTKSTYYTRVCRPSTWQWAFTSAYWSRVAYSWSLCTLGWTQHTWYRQWRQHQHRAHEGWARWPSMTRRPDQTHGRRHPHTHNRCAGQPQHSERLMSAANEHTVSEKIR